MYTEELLRSSEYISLYRFVAKKGLQSLLRAEKFLLKNNDNDLNIELPQNIFEVNDNIIHYSGIFELNKDGRYLSADITKVKGIDSLNISLLLGNKGYDYATGEAYDRKQARVDYTYENNKVNIISVVDEQSFNKQEEENKKNVQKAVVRQKRY